MLLSSLSSFPVLILFSLLIYRYDQVYIFSQQISLALTSIEIRDGPGRSRVGPKLKSGEARDRPGHSDSWDRPARGPIGPSEIWARPDR